MKTTNRRSTWTLLFLLTLLCGRDLLRPDRAGAQLACTASDTACQSCAAGQVCCELNGSCMDSVDDCEFSGDCYTGGICQVADLCVVGSNAPEPPPDGCTTTDTNCGGCGAGDYCCIASGDCITPGTDECHFTPCFTAAGCDGTQMCLVGGPTATPVPTPTPLPTSTPSGPTPTGQPTPVGPTPTPTASPSGPTPTPGSCRTLTVSNAGSESIWIGGKGGAVVPTCITSSGACLANVDDVSGDLSSCTCGAFPGVQGTLACPSGANPSYNSTDSALICLCSMGACGDGGAATTCATTTDGDTCFWTLPAPTTTTGSGWELSQNDSATFCLPPPPQVGGQESPVWWSGGLFARTGCQSDGTGCATADCDAPSNEGCPPQNGGDKPSSAAELTLQSNAPDFYDVTVINGVNVSVQVAPSGTTQTTAPAGQDADYWCETAGSGTATSALDACSWSFSPTVSGADQTSLLLNNAQPCFFNFDTSQNTGCVLPATIFPDSRGVGSSYCTASAPQGGSCLYPCNTDADCASNWGGSMQCTAVEFASGDTNNYCTCTSQSDCAGSRQGNYCGTQFFPGVATQYIQVCGPQFRAWWSAADFCSNPATDYGPLDCDASIGASSLAFLFGCTGPNAQSCYATSGVTSNCCGCGTEGALSGDWPTAASLSCNGNNTHWNDNAQPWLVFLKQGCPTAYSYPYDDATSTFNCQGPGSVNQLGYEVTFGTVLPPSLCSGEGGASCATFPDQAVGYAGSASPGSVGGGNAKTAEISDWIETATFLVKRPSGLVSEVGSGAHVGWVSYPLSRRRGSSERPRSGIVGTDAFGTHALDTRSAERLLVPAGVDGGGVPEVPLGGTADVFKCYGLKPSAGAPLPQPLATMYTDSTGTHEVVIRDFPDSLCLDADVGEGFGHELVDVACYRIRSGDGDAIKPALRGVRRAARIASVPPGGDDALALVANDRFGLKALSRGGAQEICVPIEITDRGS